MFVFALYLLHSQYHGVLQARLVKMFHANRTQGNVKVGRYTYIEFSENYIS